MGSKRGGWGVRERGGDKGGKVWGVREIAVGVREEKWGITDNSYKLSNPPIPLHCIVRHLQ